MYQFINQLLKKYGSLHHKINFIQNLRSNEDYIYKHSLNTAILCALVSSRLGLEFKSQLDIVAAALLHDVGGLMVPGNIRRKRKADITEDDEKKIAQCYQNSYMAFKDNMELSPDIKRILSASIAILHPDIPAASTKCLRLLVLRYLKLHIVSII